MNAILKLNTGYKLQYEQIAQGLLLCSFVLCLTLTTALILTMHNHSSAKDMLTMNDDSATQGLVDLDVMYADAVRVDRTVNHTPASDMTKVKAQDNDEQLKFEEKLADLEFVLQQYQMMELQTLNFVIEMPEREQVTRVMLMHLQTMLADFTAENPDITAAWKIDPNNALQLIVQLNTQRQRHWGGVGFII